MYANPLKIFAALVMTAFCTYAAWSQTGNLKDHKRPNVVIILSDDQGYADVGFHQHLTESSTPSIDEIAANGVVFTNGYVSAYVCAPSRAGLLTGRYQQRAGFYRAPDSRKGMPLSETTLAEVLKGAGYITGAFGKWHLGIDPEYHPLKRGFDEFYGFLGHGGHDYFDLRTETHDKFTSIYRNDTPISDTGYLTDNISREAASFISKHAKAGSPFFAYVAFNAVHTPMQAPEEEIKKFNTGDKDRDIQLAMLAGLDRGIGNVMNALKREGIYENTIVLFLTDNGGAKVSKANNFPLRDFKHSVYEGGLRVPYVVSWPGTFEPTKISEPVMSFDFFHTICDVLDIDLPVQKIYDGRSMLPLLTNKQKGHLHDELFWDGHDGLWAVRQQQWKLVSPKSGKLELYNLDKDLREEQNLASVNPEKVTELKEKYDAWRSEMGTWINKENSKDKAEKKVQKEKKALKAKKAKQVLDND